jgi:hypothetical protein
MSKDEMKDLPPEERIKRLKVLRNSRRISGTPKIYLKFLMELEKKKRREIEEAQEMLKETEEELTEKEDWKRKVPIPQIAAEEMEMMSEAEKEIIKAHKGLKEEETEEAEEEKLSTEESLEETVARERTGLPPELIESEEAIKLSQEPMKGLYQEIKDIYQTVEEKGYVSLEEERRIGYLSAATERKLEDIEAGKYSLTEEVAEAALLTRMIGANLRDMYKREREGQRDLYKR